MTYYVITDTLHKEPDRLILAPNQAHALRHVARRYTAKVANTHTVATMLTDGVKVETASRDQGDADNAELRG